ncbi:diguanylate cyclase (GGDEF)-like protein [Pseudoduganella lurida]|uniref:Diguanylate cyclase (GGDEF)-like protein n=1 Tax=Pseudoduganella lurida TaxID=1036180 RepID=A0A562RKD2_9BURK|nr:sensor domain-containing diguanylate cyclase [Pseudoduganella lurida]TWI69517.1 diguanylate cyclase (GGDEF)-like protein [Pseudoduganella lurida]
MLSAIHHFTSFKFKISFLVTSMVLIAGLGVGGISLLIAEVQMHRVIASQELSTLAGAAAFIDSDVRARQLALRTIAEEARAHNLDAAGLQALLEAHQGLADDFANVTAFDTHGDLVASLRDRRERRINITSRLHFQETLATGKGVISLPYRSALLERPVFAVTQPLFDAYGRQYAMLVGAVDLLRPTFVAQIEALRTSGKGYLFITTQDGTIVHHPRTELILTQPSGDNRPAVEAALTAPEGWRTDILDDGTPSLVVFKRLSHVGWTVAVSYPLRAAFAPMAAVRNNTVAAAGLFTALAGVFGWLFVKTLTQPLDQLQHKVEAMGRGKTDIDVFNVDARDEFGLLSRALYRLSQLRQQSEDELKRMASTDVLTGAHNRRMFDQFLPTALARARRAGEQVAVAFLDVDRFKAINDTHGHGVGDAVLVEFTRRLQGAVRCTDTVARLAGDEFVIVYEQLHAVEEAHQLGAKIMTAMAAPFRIGDLVLRVTTSVGIAVARHASSAEAIMHSADYALYGVKAAGRNGYAVNVVGAEKLASVHGHQTMAQLVNRSLAARFRALPSERASPSLAAST